MNYFAFESPAGPITVMASERGVTGVCFGRRTPPEGQMGESGLIARCREEIEEYFAGKRQEFDLPLEIRGTPFQERVWAALRSIPYGQSFSYAQIAQRAGVPKGYRAAGMACHTNPVAILIPCHRVVGKRGDLGGYAGGTDIKKMLLELERENVKK